ncbi:hypothetical protein [Kribbella ginsengisoli]|uniref:Fibronectin type-III domain-containing protein n=1 Tax=Kribbella ginsengisoli TaxID=363865 RepID=A0ABP6X4J0_9ACTN
MKLRSAVAAACLLALLPVGSSTAANAAEPPIHLGEGTLLAPRLEADPPIQIVAATSKYYLTDYGWPTDFTPAPWSIKSVLDGTVKGDFPRQNIDMNATPDIVGEYAVKWSDGDAAARRLGTDDLQVINAPAGTTVRNVYPGGVLLARGDAFALRTYAGAETPVTGVTATAKVLDRTDDDFLLGTATGLYVLDVATGTATQAATLTAETTWAQLTPGRVIWQTASSDTTTTLAWKQRTGSDDGTVVVPFKQPLLPLGDDVAVRVPDTKELVKVSLQDGAVTRNLATGVHDAEDQGNGRLLVTAQAQVASVGADGVLQTIAQTPPFHGQSEFVMLSGSKVVTDAAVPPQTGVRDDKLTTVHQTSDLGLTWTDAAVTEDQFRHPPQFAGNALATTRVRYDGTEYGLVTDGKGTIQFDGPVVHLGRGGKLVAVGMPNSSEFVQVYDLAARKMIDPFPLPVGLNGQTIWTGPDWRDNLTATTNGFSTTYPAGPGCGPAQGIQAAGRWVVVDCAGTDDRIIDVQGQVPTRTITLGPRWKLGYDFLVQDTAGTVISPSKPIDLVVTDLNTLNLAERRYGPVAAYFWTSPRYQPDDADAARLVYNDRNRQPRIVTLDWLAPQPTVDTDHLAPVLDNASSGPDVQSGSTLLFRYSFTDNPAGPDDRASGIAEYDVRYQQRPSPTAPFGDVVTPAAWQRLPKHITNVSLEAAPGTTTCFQVRARDRAGNQTEWSHGFCTEVDGTPPTLTSSSVGERVITAATGKYSYAFTDNSGKVASYDVVYRDAIAGQAYGKWQYPATWQATTATSVTWTPVAGVDRCFMVRARDATGHLSGWSAPACAVAPQDDRALTATGTVTRATSSITYKGTISQLKATGATLTKAGEAGLRIALVTVNGPGQGSVDVYHAGVKIGRVSLLAPSSKVTVTLLPVTPYRTGELKIVSAGAAQAVIDGVAFLRS